MWRKRWRSLSRSAATSIDGASFREAAHGSALRTARNGQCPGRAAGGCAAKGRALHAPRRREIEPRVGGAYAGLGQAEFAAHDVGALDQRDAFVIGDAARQ